MTKNQEKQLAYADQLERRECYRNDLGILTSLDCSCRTCGVNKHFNCADSIRNFVYLHEGHDTWVKFIAFHKASVR